MSRPRKYKNKEESAAAKRLAAKRWRIAHPAAYSLIQHRGYMKRKAAKKQKSKEGSICQIKPYDSVRERASDPAP